MQKDELKSEYKRGLNYGKGYVTLNQDNADNNAEFTIYANRLANTLAKTMQKFSNENLDSQTLLEIGCGMGRLVKPFSIHFNWVTGIDISSEILMEAKAYLIDVPNVVLYENDGKSLILFKDESFDNVVTTGVLQHITQRSIIGNYLREAIRVLKVDGLFLFTFQIWQKDVTGYGRIGAKISSSWLNSIFENLPVQLLEVSVDSNDSIPHMIVIVRKTTAESDFMIVPEIVKELPYRTLCWKNLLSMEKEFERAMRPMTFFDDDNVELNEVHRIAGLFDDLKKQKYRHDLRWKEFSEVFINEVKKANMFVDCGAEYGYYIGLALSYAKDGCQIVAIEPEPPRYNALVSFFEYYKNIEILPYAVAEQEGEISIYKTEGRSASIDKNLTQWGNVEKEEIKVKSVTLDSLLKNRIPDIVKMDIAGAEVFALPGMKQTMLKYAPVIFLEYHPSFIDSLTSNGEQKIINLLQECHYDVYNHFGEKCSLNHSRVILATSAKAKNIAFLRRSNNNQMLGSDVLLAFSKYFNMFYEQIQVLKQLDYQNIIIYGAGTVGKSIQRFFPQNVVAFIDQNAHMIELENEIKVEVKHPDALKEMNYDIIVISVLGREKQISEILIAQYLIDKNKVFIFSFIE